MSNELGDLMVRATSDLQNPDTPAQVVRRWQRKRRTRIAAVSIMAAAAVTAAVAVPIAVSSTTSGGDTIRVIPVGPSPSNSAAAQREVLPAELVGMWRVTDAAGEPAGTVVRIDAQQPESLILFRGCGELDGAWVASRSGGFLGSMSGFSMACLNSIGTGDPTPAWLAEARSFAVRGSERELLAADGRVVGRLLPGGRAKPAADIAPSLTAPPTLTAGERLTLNTPAQPLPANETPATVATLTGKWTPYPVKRYDSPQQPFLSFTADGGWSGSDGCNKPGGKWRLGSTGELLSLGGPLAGVGCLGFDVASMVPSSGRAAISGNLLTFYAGSGKVLGRLTR